MIMLKLLIVADDFTGALDTGVQFASLGASAKVVTSPQCDSSQLSGLDVLIFDAESRHKDPSTAYRTVYDFVKSAAAFGVEHVYKKTDSGLRGNVGAELAGAMDALGVESMAFIPAFPDMNRITKGGIHYIGGVPVGKSMFAADPFNPVKFSDVREIVASQTDKKGIRIYDAESDSDMESIAASLGGDGLRLTAGCAGFAKVLAKVLGFCGKAREIHGMPERFLMLCGSVNPVTRAQMDFAVQHGFRYMALTPEQKLDSAWPDSPECHEAAKKWLEGIADCNSILDANNPAETAQTNEYIKTHTLTLEEVMHNISHAIAGAGKALIDGGLDARLMCVGGDTLLALMEAVGVYELVPLCEEELGVVLTSFEYSGKRYYIMTKSGGFGEPDLLVRLAGKF